VELVKPRYMQDEIIWDRTSEDCLVINSNFSRICYRFRDIHG